MTKNPWWRGVVFPAISVLTVLGIIPFAGAVARQIWVKYEFTSRRIRVTSGIGGNDETEVIYPEIDSITSVRRGFGVADVGDLNILLKDGSKLEIRSVPNFTEVLKFVQENAEKGTIFRGQQ
mmetsp:Transcript_29881/g.74255  ORF Transcript_29881/g.74255 Transcript_29881/m.74255 type:complete len:122 (-) Transcript_29881:67-432(-)